VIALDSWEAAPRQLGRSKRGNHGELERSHRVWRPDHSGI
jgi:hypothetical protein